MQYINWSDFITEELINRIFTAANADVDLETLDKVNGILPMILNATGGFPVFDAVPNDNAKTSLAITLLEEACRHTISILGFRPIKPALLFDTLENDQVFKYELKAVPHIHVNLADSTLLINLKGIGETLATRIVLERLSNGPYLSMKELTKRVNGFGEELAKDFRHIFSFALPADVTSSMSFTDTNYENYYSILQSQFNYGSPTTELIGLLDIVATYANLPKHPELLDPFIPRKIPNPPQNNSTNAQWVGVLARTSYYYNLPQIIAKASTSIDLCMFHISFPSEAHPTRNLLDSLIAANTNGVTVRVMADQDRESDPYNSTLINLPALRFLIQNGIECKVDSFSELLHAKYLIIDDHIVIIGSHNWSAGSYFQFDDHSLVIESDTFAAITASRFNNLWLNGVSIESIDPL